MSEINDIEELSEVIPPINLKLIYQYQHKYPRLMAKYNMGTAISLLCAYYHPLVNLPERAHS